MITGNLLADLTSSIPGSLRLDGELLQAANWARTDADESRWNARHESGLAVTVEFRRFTELGVIEWKTKLENSGHERSGLISNLSPLDVLVPSDQSAVLSSINGSLCQLDDFAPWSHNLSADGPRHIEPQGGRSSDGAAPFFTLDLGGAAVTIAIGWSGQWYADLEATADGVQVTAGFAGASLRLEPGEAITLPSVMAAVGAVPKQSENALRRAIDRHIAPHYPNGSFVTPLAHMTMSTFHRTHKVSEASELAAVKRAAELDLEAFWVDACWYGDTPDWSEQVGNWYVRTADFPRGLRPIGDAVHKAGLKFVVWMEPERARKSSRLVAEHPEFFLEFPDQPENRLLDLGNQAACEHILELISGYITEFGIDVYRQDFNIRPLSAWQAADEPDRRGIHEVRHIEGLYWLWDELLRRHPSLVIDNCASGGRRIDLESLRRAVPLWRSDAADVGGGAVGDAVSLANQTQVSGLSRFVTQHTGPIWAFEPYAIRSAIGTGFVVYCPLPVNPDSEELLRGAIAETKRIRPLLSGDFYVVSPPPDGGGWRALQFDRPEIGDGALILLRPPACAIPTAQIDLRGIDARARYQVTTSASYEQSLPVEMLGSELAALQPTITNAPGSLLVEYERLS